MINVRMKTEGIIEMTMNARKDDTEIEMMKGIEIEMTEIEMKREKGEDERRRQRERNAIETKMKSIGIVYVDLDSHLSKRRIDW